MPTASPVTHELINDLPLLMHVLHDTLQYDEILDRVHPRHGNWQGLRLGQVLVTWLMHILSEHNHFMNQVQEWSAQVPQLLAAVWGQPLRPTDLTGDRLAEVVRLLSLDPLWKALEQQVDQRMIQVYDLPTQRVRLDTTTVSV